VWTDTVKCVSLFLLSFFKSLEVIVLSKYKGNSKRKPMDSKYSKKLFSRTADHVHPKNAPRDPIMRGGIRL